MDIGSWFVVVGFALVVFTIYIEIRHAIEASKPLFVVFIPEGHYGVVIKKFLFKRHRRIPEWTCVALHGEAGPQADLLMAGWHYGYWPFRDQVELYEPLRRPERDVVVVKALGGKALPQGRSLGTFPRDKKGRSSFLYQQSGYCHLDARRFLEGGGERGVQAAALQWPHADGIYYNPYLFEIELVPAVKIPKRMMGIVTTLAGAELPEGRTVAPTVSEDDCFEDAEAFIAAGGFKGMQERVLLPRIRQERWNSWELPYVLNPYFARVEIIPELSIPQGAIGFILDRDEGDIIAPGASNVDAQAVSASTAKRFEIRGLASPGDHPINPHYQKVELVPTDHIALNWAPQFESHRFDKNLRPINVALADGWNLRIEVTLFVYLTFERAGNELIASFGSFKKFAVDVLQRALESYFGSVLTRREDVDAFFVAQDEHQRRLKERVAEAAARYEVRVLAACFGDHVDLSQSASASAMRREAPETTWS